MGKNHLRRVWRNPTSIHLDEAQRSDGPHLPALPGGRGVGAGAGTGRRGTVWPVGCELGPGPGPGKTLSREGRLVPRPASRVHTFLGPATPRPRRTPQSPRNPPYLELGPARSQLCPRPAASAARTPPRSAARTRLMSETTYRCACPPFPPTIKQGRSAEDPDFGFPDTDARREGRREINSPDCWGLGGAQREGTPRPPNAAALITDHRAPTAPPGRAECSGGFLPLAAPLPSFFFLFGNQCVSYYPALPCPAAGRAEQRETPCWLSSQDRAEQLRGSFTRSGSPPAPRPPGPRPPPRPVRPPPPPRGVHRPASRSARPQPGPPGGAGGIPPPPPRVSGGRGRGTRTFRRGCQLRAPGPPDAPPRNRPRMPPAHSEPGPWRRGDGPGCKAEAGRARALRSGQGHPPLQRRVPPGLFESGQKQRSPPLPHPPPLSPRTIVAFRV